MSVVSGATAWVTGESVLGTAVVSGATVWLIEAAASPIFVTVDVGVPAAPLAAGATVLRTGVATLVTVEPTCPVPVGVAAAAPTTLLVVVTAEAATGAMDDATVLPTLATTVGVEASKCWTELVAGEVAETGACGPGEDGALADGVPAATTEAFVVAVTVEVTDEAVDLTVGAAGLEPERTEPVAGLALPTVLLTALPTVLLTALPTVLLTALPTVLALDWCVVESGAASRRRRCRWRGR